MEPDTADNRVAYLASLYRSTLTVTGTFPGVYQYSASNRATTPSSTDSFNIEGMYITTSYFNVTFLPHITKYTERDFWIAIMWVETNIL
jgi:hypothetical protein